ncbi:MAG: 3-phosphoshikimate 1-carboxyvinyltransferase [Clostridia bacterium]|nr:3-phosphoshikimate 1-carboxyvinyltransferase [Clostridia bacterium]
MKQIITPGHLAGTVCVPPSKSQAHRAVIAAALAGGGSQIENLVLSQDISATMQAMSCFAALSFADGVMTAQKGAPVLEEELTFDCNESGSTIRFLIPLALTLGKKVHFTGRGRLLERPLDPYFDICDTFGITYERTADKISFCGKLSAGDFALPGNISSQFITGLLFALPLLSGDSTITLTTEAESVGYIDMTLEILSLFGIEVERKDVCHYFIPGGQSYKPYSMRVEGDYSQAAFYLCANAMGSRVDVQGLSDASCQGDKAILSVIRQFGSPLSAIDLDVSQIPDLVPVLAVLATQAEGTTHLTGAARLRIKESDRLETTTDMLTRFGAQVTEGADSLAIVGKTPLLGCTIDSHNDHRIAMAAAIGATVASGEVTILGSECVAKSYGNFWQDYEALKK